MKPNPLLSLNHFTFPVMRMLKLSLNCGQKTRKGPVSKPGPFAVLWVQRQACSVPDPKIVRLARELVKSVSRRSNPGGPGDSLYSPSRRPGAPRGSFRLRRLPPMQEGLFAALALAALTVGPLHTLAPDHWVPFAAVARARGWSAARTARVTLL